MKSKARRETRSLPPIRGSAQLQAETLDEESRTVEVTFYSGAPVLRIPMFDEPYELEFEVSEQAADLSRLNGGASIIDSHRTYAGVSGILGVVEEAWLENGGGRARLRFSAREEVAPVFQDVRDGIVRNVSMGTYILAMDEVTKKGAELKRFRATAWQPYEISFVAVPADAGAQVMQAADEEKGPCTIQFSASAEAAGAPSRAGAPKGETMKIKVRLLANVEDVGKLGDIVEIEEADFDETLHTKDLTPPAPEVSSEGLIAQQLAADKKRRTDIREIATYYDLDEVWSEAQHQSGIPIEQVLTRAEAERKKRAPEVRPNAIGMGNDYESNVFKQEQMAAALAARATGKPAPEPARPYARMSFGDVALACLEAQGKGRGLDPRWDRAEIFSANFALHTTSDFPLVLANTLNKVLLPEYENRAPTYRMLAARREFRDYRVHDFDRAGDFPVPLQVGEHGEYQYGTMGENREQVTLAKYGRILAISRETLVNDDLGAFAMLAMKAARRVVDFENATWYSVCILPNAGLGPNLSDGNPVYDAAHSNVLSGGVLATARLDEGRQLMMDQESIDGLKLNVNPRYALTSPASAGLSERLVAPQSMLIGQGADAAPVPDANNWAGRLTPVADANLTGARYYLLADPAELEQYIYGYLQGQAGPRTEVRNGFQTDGVEFKLALDFGCGAIEYRAGVTGAGS